MAKILIAQKEVVDAIAAGKKQLRITRGSIVTPLARELIISHGIEIVEGEEQKSVPPLPSRDEHSVSSDLHGKSVAFGSDHGGFELKEELKKYTESLGFKALDLGTHNSESCDYPDFAYAVARSVASGEAWRGVMIDGAGIGSCVVANKVPGVKAACCHNEFVARNAREHNDTNVLTLGSRVTGVEVCKSILKIWLETSFSGGRHKQRVDKINEVEKRFIR